MKPTHENWRAVPGYEGLYEVSDQGRVRSLDRIAQGRYGMKELSGGIRKCTVGNHGYRMVALSRNGKYQHFTVHRLVLLAFVGERPNGLAVRHLNGCKTDNSLSNLAYGTYTENNRDIVEHGRNRNASKTHCKRGHQFTPENTLTHPSGMGRTCRLCQRRLQSEHTVRKTLRGRNAEVRQNNDKEKWLPVVGFEGSYSVSDQGRVRSEARYVRCLSGSPENLVESQRLVKPRILKTTLSSGYPKVTLGLGNGRRIHNLVLEAFVGPKPARQVVRHLNDDPLDNWLNNLAYGTPLENAEDRIRNSLTA